MNLRPRRLPAPEINVTPLIDVVFLLLIFFMASTTFRDDTRIRVQLPEAEGETPGSNQQLQKLVITIDAEGVYYIGERRAGKRGVESLKRAMEAVLGDSRHLPVLIRADASTPHQAVMTAMDAARQLGLLQITFAATRPVESQ